MNRATFEKFRSLIYAESGIVLSEGKEALVTARVAKRVRALQLPDHETYLEHVSGDSSGEELVHLLDAISTNVTSFFREAGHFTCLDAAVREWLKEGRRKIRIWCAAASTGEEPYTLAMTLREATAGHDVDAKILATDISTKALQAAQRGRYDERRASGIPLNLRDKYFMETDADGVLCFEAKSVLRELLVFNRLNLAHTPFPMRGPFDAVFCRNVMIYFDNTVRKNLLQEIHRLVRPGGHLFVGHSESLTGLVADFKSVQPAAYVKP